MDSDDIILLNYEILFRRGTLIFTRTSSKRQARRPAMEMRFSREHEKIPVSCAVSNRRH